MRGLNLFFTDEQYGRFQGNEFALVLGFSIPAATFAPFRRNLYSGLADILGLVLQKEGSIAIAAPPLLHGSDFLRDYVDSKKLEVLRFVFDLLRQTDCGFFRVGYFLASTPDGIDVQMRRKFCLQASLHAIWFGLNKEGSHPTVVVSEFDKEGLRKAFSAITDHIGMYYQMDDGSLSVSLDKMIGHFFAKKDELGCQIADLVAYVSLKAMSDGSEFHNAVGGEFEKISHMFLADRIIWWNDSSRSIIRV